MELTSRDFDRFQAKPKHAAEKKKLVAELRIIENLLDHVIIARAACTSVGQPLPAEEQKRADEWSNEQAMIHMRLHQITKTKRGDQTFV